MFILLFFSSFILCPDVGFLSIVSCLLYHAHIMSVSHLLIGTVFYILQAGVFKEILSLLFSNRGKIGVIPPKILLDTLRMLCLVSL